MPLVSVVVRAWNRAALVGETLASVAAQTERDLEIIVVDDGSTDDTAVVVDGFARSEPRLRLVRQEHRGPAAALNAGVRAAAGEYVGFLDSDDLWEPSCVARRLEVLQARPGLGAVLADWTSFGAPGEPARPSPRGVLPAAEGDLLAALFETHFFSLCAALMPARVLAAVGPFDEALGAAEDYDWGLRMALDHPMVFLDEPLLRVRSHGAHITSDPRIYRFRCLVLERFAAAHADRIPRALRIRRLSGVNAMVGDILLAAGDGAAARPYLLRSLRWNPWQGPALKNLLRSFTAGPRDPGTLR